MDLLGNPFPFFLVTVEKIRRNVSKMALRLSQLLFYSFALSNLYEKFFVDCIRFLFCRSKVRYETTVNMLGSFGNSQKRESLAKCKSLERVTKGVNLIFES